MNTAITEQLLPLLVAGLVGYCMQRVALQSALRMIVDAPNHRSMHDRPIPRTGGWALVVGVAAGLVLSIDGWSLVLALAFASLFLISALDDVGHIPAAVRFPVHVFSVVLVLIALPGTLVWWQFAVLLFAGAWMINLYNFMDGIDGLAASMTAVGFSILGLLSALRGFEELATICGLLVVGALVFLRFNWPPAKIFLGDVGSTSLGLSAFVVSVYGWQAGAFSLLAPLILFAPFWLDATLTLVGRILSGKRWWEAHREHFYQRSALQNGVRSALLFQLKLMLLLSTVVVILALSGLV